ncbi:winged helix-turn-helix transcriptional regulator [Candidatus Gottesmanbacteria bacterium]|nr:winged helix-turn-helix transcriptional regulator [Candidatus Gottesmanbacteria bacterium]
MIFFHISEREIGFRIHKLVFLIDKTTDKILNEQLQITHSQVIMMHAIKHRGEVSQTDIAKYWQITDAAVSRQVEILATKGFIKLWQNPQNRRENLLSLTGSGQNYLQKAFKLLDKTFSELFQVLSASERKILIESLDKLLQKLCKVPYEK